MTLTVIRPPEFEPISLEQARLHLRVDAYPGSPDSHPDDDLIMRAIQAARERAEQITRRALVEQGIRLSASGWYPDRWPGSGARGIDLLKPPLISVDQVSYYDSENVLQTVSSSDYFVEDSHPVARLRWARDFDYPDLYDRADAVRIDYTAGYQSLSSPALIQADAANAIPASIINAMLLLIGDMYEYREKTVVGTIVAVTTAADNLLESYRVHNF